MSLFDALPRFLAVGVANTSLTLLIIFLAKGIFALGDALSNAIGYAFGLVLSFALNRRWTFRHVGSLSRSLPAFLLVQLVAYLANLFCVLGLIRYGVDSYWAQVFGIPPYTIIAFLGSRLLAFPASEPGRKV